MFWRQGRRRGKVLAVKLGYNPNSSSLGADVTFLLFGATAVGMLTPLVGALLKWRRPAAAKAAEVHDAQAAASAR